MQKSYGKLPETINGLKRKGYILELNVKGVLVNGYGISSDEDTDALIARLNTHPE